ncbi:unnamed protein product [Albugo candida]|uniref:Uncharacterized protein n=1 Tax=Albugo candida TaxID=65357 RepID=A0A024GDZ8_9STRA|nr:unnamed protein product [Albugo candida]|eukprot:CCI44565.1 unnamed protein product [Albugo candida]
MGTLSCRTRSAQHLVFLLCTVAGYRYFPLYCVKQNVMKQLTEAIQIMLVYHFEVSLRPNAECAKRRFKSTSRSVCIKSNNKFFNHYNPVDNSSCSDLFHVRGWSV